MELNNFGGLLLDVASMKDRYVYLHFAVNRRMK